MMRGVAGHATVLLAVCLLCGCTPYEFDLVEPPDLATHIRRSNAQQVAFSRDHLDYRLRAVEGRLVMWISNPADDHVQLLGEESYVVDPDGQSHPARGQSIAPHSFIKLILPPMGHVYGAGPAFSFGLEVTYNGPNAPERGDAAYGGPQYCNQYESADAVFWTWDGESSIRMRLSFLRRDERFHDDLVFRRVKVK